MYKSSTKALIKFALLIQLIDVCYALESDKKEDFILDADNNSAILKSGENQQKFWGNVVIQQGTMKISSDEAVVTQSKAGVNEITLTGKPVKMKQFIDEEYGNVDIKADKIVYLVSTDIIKMSGNVQVKSKIQGEMTGENITFNTKTKEIKGASSGDQRVRLIIRPNQ